MEFVLIALLYAPHRLNRAMQVLRYLRAQTRPVRTAIVINGNRIDPGMVRNLIPNAVDVKILCHDNTGAEFGGYQAGLDGLDLKHSDCLIVMNDTVGTHDPVTKSFLSRFVRNLRLAPRGSVVGRIDSSGRRLQLDGRWTSRWVRSHLFGLDGFALELLGGHLYDWRVDNFIAPVPEPDRFFGAEVRGVLRAHLEEWLFSSGNGNWYAAQPLTASNCEAMAIKARSILQELHLSMRLEAAEILFRPLLQTRQERLRHLLQRTATALGRRVIGARTAS